MHYTDRRPTKLSILPTTGGAAISVHPVPTGPKKNNYTKGAGFEEAQGGWVRYTGGIVLSRPEYLNLNPTPVLPDSPFKNGNPNREIRAKKRKQSGEIKKT